MTLSLVNTATLVILASMSIVFADNDKSLILSTKNVKADVTSDDIFTDFEDNRISILVLSSLNGNDGGSNVALNARSFAPLNLENSVTIDENCVLLCETIKRIKRSVSLNTIKAPESIGLVSKGLWLYTPSIDQKAVAEFGGLFAKAKKDNQITFVATTCSWNGLMEPEKRKQKNENEVEIRTTPVIVQQISVLLLFSLILAMGLYYTLDVKTPSSLLVPPQMQKKKTN
ncbi:uncharacterized protein BEWA_028060 [Theileria equi strain WA]|uniref:Membrane protein, putative n=1 Tax=Theileria equi strain WA TaxID=1537102 RepID=L0AWJ2_THEEQ|nr:uncharacterized protein BEWA_028060 [Theileria equi strain WA]AFZ79957.1 membrane protein, putative [Theileria equi strain WA]|eukprot:XP_004829623.1 uncharacterized protein BEWA_028060 [Theileria equi strain WA]